MNDNFIDNPKTYPEMNEKIVKILRMPPNDSPVALYAAQLIEEQTARIAELEAENQKMRCEELETEKRETVNILNEYQLSKITVKDTGADKTLAVITNQEIITADDSIVVVFTPPYGD